MAAEASISEPLQDFILDALSGWDAYTALIIIAIVTFLGYSLMSSKDPDLHPYLLARQATEAPVRQPGESAVFRGLETPHWLPLKTGLNIKDPKAPKWTAGRNGDLRDIWKAAVQGVQNSNGVPPRECAKIYTVLGKNVLERSLEDITQEINVVGKYINEAKPINVALSLSDSVELLASIFAGAFYGFHISIIPHHTPSELLSTYLQTTQAQILIAEAGAVDLSVIMEANKQLNHVIWVVKQGSRHMEWNVVPEGIGGDFKVSVWHELVKDKKDSVGSEVPAWDLTTKTPSITSLWPSSTGVGELIEYTPQTLVAAIGALSSCLPPSQQLTPRDLVLSVDSLSHPYALCWIMVALFSNASIALTSVAGESVDFALATAGVSPTTIIASSRTLCDYHNEFMGPHTGIISKIARWLQARSLDAGMMPSQNMLTRLAYLGPTAELSLGKLRLLIASCRIDDDPNIRLGTNKLTDLRIFTGARIVYALAVPGVAGAVTQTHVFDYRNDGSTHFGAPLGSVEITLTGHRENTGLERAAEGEITVAGPAAVSKRVSLPTRARFRHDNTLELCS